MHPQKFKNVLDLPPQNRYWYFVRKAADSQVVWGLQGEEGRWVVSELESGVLVYPLWPEREYAAASRIDSWRYANIASVSIQLLLEEWLPRMHQSNEKVGVFWDLGGFGVEVDPLVLMADLIKECENY